MGIFQDLAPALASLLKKAQDAIFNLPILLEFPIYQENFAEQRPISPLAMFSSFRINGISRYTDLYFAER